MASTTGTGKLVPARGLTTRQLAEIQALAAACERVDGIPMRLNWEMLAARPADQVNDFLWYEEQALLGFLGLYTFREVEAEAAAITHPAHRRQGILRRLVSAAAAELRRRGTPDLVFFCEHTLPAAAAAMAALGAAYEYSEYLMEAAPEAVRSADTPPDLALRQAVVADLPLLATLDDDAFGGAAHMADWLAQKLADPDQHVWVITLRGAPIGKILGRVGEADSFITGFVIERRYRGQGYGRAALALTMQNLLAERRQTIALEVAATNEQALGLYRGRGFAVVTAYDYYRLPVGRAGAGVASAG